MRYPTMGETRQYQLALPQLSGGVNYSVLPTLIDDNQLSDVKNLWFRDGVLKTRPGISHKSEAEFTSKAETIAGYHAFDDSFCAFGSYDDGNATKTKLFFDFSQNVDYIITDHAKRKVVPWFCESRESGTEFPMCYYYHTNESKKLVGKVASFSGYMFSEKNPYVPTVVVGGVPKEKITDAAEGTGLEPFNLLTGDYKCKYTSNGKGGYFRLPKANGISSISVFVTNKNGTVSEFYVYETDGIEEYKEDEKTTRTLHVQEHDTTGLYLVADLKDGVCWIAANNNSKDASVLAQTGIANDITIVVESANSDENIRKIYGMQFSEWYGGGSAGLSGGTRLFVSGNPEHPSLVHWSALNDPLYFPENNYALVGEDTKRVTAFGKQEDLLVIFKDGELYCTKYYDGQSVTYEQLENQEVIDIEAARAVFPIVQLHPSVGCDRPKTVCLCNNRLVWFNSDGKVYGLFSANQYSERNVRELSLNVDKKLRGMVDKNASAAEFENHYLLCLGDTVFSMDFSSVGFTYFASYSSDEKSQKAVRWYVWEFDKNYVVFNQGKKVVFLNFATNEDTTSFYFCEMNDPESKGSYDDIAVSLSTKRFDFGHANRYKRINPFYLHIGGESGKIANLTYLNENGECYDAYQPIFTGENLLSASPIRVTPNAIRTRTFGIKIESNGYIEIGGMTLNYSLMGTVR